jgi:hypothetical protein
MVWSILICGIIVATVGVICVHLFRVRPRAEISKRSPISVAELYRLHYLDSGILQPDFEKHWMKIAVALEEPAELLRPSDRFAVELPARGYFDYSNDKLIEYARGCLGSEFKLESIASLDQLVRALSLNRRPP